MAAVAAAWLSGSAAFAATPVGAGPYNASFLPGGIGITHAVENAGLLTAAGASYTLSTWVRPNARQLGQALLIRLGDRSDTRALSLDDGRVVLRDGAAILRGPLIAAGEWTHVAAASTGAVATIFVNGRAVASGRMVSVATTQTIAIAPPSPGQPHFGGKMSGAKAEDAAETSAAIAATVRDRPDFETVQFWDVGVGWLFQRSANIGQTREQDAWTLPNSRGDAAYTKAIARPRTSDPILQPVSPQRWQVNGWTLAVASEVSQNGSILSRPGAGRSAAWLAATVPGTVLQTLVDRGVYPDPYYGLNNLRIPEKLARQDYWYRTSFTVPPRAAGKQLTLVFGGINYASEIWANGKPLGKTRGAFIRGQFEFSPMAGENVVAVLVSPPPHPGIPHEQSVAGGVGENGGQLAIDGPTFVATEGWDWIPGIRDRNTGLWRPVELVAHGAIRILDPHVVTDLPLPRTDSADVHVSVPIENQGAAEPVTVHVAFEGVEVSKTVNAPTGRSEVSFAPAEFPQLRVSRPKLWWPNGYGEPHLYGIDYTVADGAGTSDSVHGRFGMREVSYDLSLFDHDGALRRVTVQPTNGALAGTKLIDVRHAAIKQTPTGWAESLTSAGEKSPFVIAADTHLPEPHLVIRVNGVPIAARGGSWGMDDAMKRVSYASLAPYFRLEREAHMNVVRNWMGNNTEDEFYDLADENGIMVLNDFWQSTQNYQIEPDDPQLFLANARDSIAHNRNHPSIVVWFGRNEGVPYPTLNEGLDQAVFELDGTRWYTGSSNEINLQGSGPYNYRRPVGYHTDLATGFSVETGTPSLATPEAIAAYVPRADRWPLGDVLAYHDWHFAGNGDTKTFVAAMDTMFGPASSFEDFERKAQMMQMESHKAIVEGFLGHLWTKNSGRLFWMTHPSWPSNTWQLYSSDYDAGAAYYGAKKAAEPLHVQLNLPSNELVVVNTTREERQGLIARVRVVGIDGRELWARDTPVDVAANRATVLAAVPLEKLFATNPAVLVRLELLSGGAVIADNFYWRGRDDAALRALSGLAPAAVTVTPGRTVVVGADNALIVTLANATDIPALNARLVLVDEAGKRVLPAYWSDNYVSLLPGERRELTVRVPSGKTGAELRLDGWNVPPATVSLKDRRLIH